MKLKSSFVCCWSQNGIYIPNSLLFSSCLAISNVSNWWFCFTKFSVDFQCFRETRKSRKDLVYYFPKRWMLFVLLTKFCKSFSVIRREVSKYCSKLSIQTENWILKQFFAHFWCQLVPSCLLLSSFLVTKSFSSEYFLIQNNFCWFPVFQGFRSLL